jgi:hypothetical protein
VIHGRDDEPVPKGVQENRAVFFAPGQPHSAVDKEDNPPGRAVGDGNVHHIPFMGTVTQVLIPGIPKLLRYFPGRSATGKGQTDKNKQSTGISPHKHLDLAAQETL